MTRWAKVCALLAAAAAAAAFLSTGPASSRPTRLNVVLILSDDQRAGTFEVMPNLRRLLLARGVNFVRFFVTTSECCPSRASILTGQYSHHTGVVQNFGLRGYPAFDERSSLAVWLQRAGYQTALVGKYLNDYPIYGHHHIPAGWSTWDAIDSVPEERYYDYSVNENGADVNYGSSPADYSTDVLTRLAAQFVRRTTGPFFLYFAPVAPHLPAIPAQRDLGSIPVPPPPTEPAFDERDVSDKPWARFHSQRLGPKALRFLARDIRRRQLESLRAVDRSVAVLVRALKERGELDRTVILYASDNGFLWGEHRLGGKLWPYEESIRVPLVVRAPWMRRPRTDRHLVLNIDLASTIAELAGVAPRLPQDGRSFVPFLLGRNPPWRTEFVAEYLGASQLHSGGPPPFYALRTRQYLYVEYLNGWRELYDLARDPAELHNVASEPAFAETRRRLAAQLEQLVRAPPRP